MTRQSRFTATAADLAMPGQCLGPCCNGLRADALRPRTDFLGLFAAGAGASDAKAPSLGSGRVIDVHHHYFSPEFKESAAKGGMMFPAVRDWSPERMMEEMDKNKVDKTILSLASVPVHWFSTPKEDMRPLLRAINEYGAGLRDANPNRHGFFSFITVNDIEGSLAEIEHAYSKLNADGIEIATSFGDKWPGDPEFAPVFEELNRRNSIVYLHPLAPCACLNIVNGVGDSWAEYPHDTTRAILSLLVHGAFAKYPNIRFIFSHGGGTIPILAARAEALSKFAPNRKDFAPEGSIMPVLQRQYYETANATSAPMVAALKAFIPMTQLMFGTDYPYVSTEANLKGLRAADFTAEELKMIEHGNAEKLIPALIG
jgi:predicted TIM-barrel fold metal-dependent hydrolase